MLRSVKHLNQLHYNPEIVASSGQNFDYKNYIALFQVRKAEPITAGDYA
jgi:hypothetical protein